jgi:hypothetical protein
MIIPVIPSEAKESTAASVAQRANRGLLRAALAMTGRVVDFQVSRFPISVSRFQDFPSP